MKDLQRKGVSMQATIKETVRAMATVSGRAMMNSPAVPVRMSRGKNEQTMVTVAVRTGTKTSVAERHAASALGTL